MKKRDSLNMLNKVKLKNICMLNTYCQQKLRVSQRSSDSASGILVSWVMK